VILSQDTGASTGDFDAAFLVDGASVPVALTQAGPDGYHDSRVAAIFGNGGSGVVSMRVSPTARGHQLVVVSRRPFAAIATDAGTTEAPSDLIESRAIYELAAMFKPGVDRARMEALMRLHGAKFTKLAGGLIDKPVPTLESVLVRGV
jgi:hypothetical protein